MADTKITGLQTPGAFPVVPSTDVLPIVIVADNSMAASGSTRKVTVNQILGAGGTATLASATISGDLTVDTSTLKVDSANNRVGIGTATPARPLDIVGSFQSSLGWVLTGTPAGLGAATRYIGGASTTDSWYFNALTGGNHLWAFGESLAMTLNSTGLGVGVTPSAWNSAIKAVQSSRSSIASNGITTWFGSNVYYDSTYTPTYIANEYAGALAYNPAGFGGWAFYTASAGTGTITGFATAKMTLDESGNLGIGVTPSYLLHTAVASGANRNIARFQVTGASNGLTITWNHATTKMIVNFSNLPTSSAGLASGDLWIDTAAGNTLKVA